MASSSTLIPPMYATNVLRACTVVTVAHVVLGLGLAKFFRGEQLKGFPLYTYWHSMINTGLVFPAFLLYLAAVSPAGWLEGDGKVPADELGAAQWVQATNIGMQVASTVLSPKEVFGSPALVVHHIITILGCFALLHPLHCPSIGPPPSTGRSGDP